MKALIIALFVTVAFTASLDNVHFHFHVDRPVGDARMNKFVSNLINSFVNKDEKQNIDIHLHFSGDEGSLSAAAADENDDDNEIEDFGFGDIVKPFKDGFDKVKDGVGTVVDGVKKGFDITKDGINTAISKSKDAFNKVKDQIQSINLPSLPISYPGVVEKPIESPTDSLVPCAANLQKAVPNMVRFAAFANSNNPVLAVNELVALLEFMPDITQKCLNKSFTIPPTAMNKFQCTYQLMALDAAISQFISTPEEVLGSMQGLEGMIDLIPQTVAVCTGAFN